MPIFFPRSVAFAFLALTTFLFSPPASAVIRDGGIDPSNLGRGSWIYILPDAIDQMNGNVPLVTNLTSMMRYMKNQGLQYVIIKAGQGAMIFPSSGNPQFTPEVVQAGHEAGLLVFGYIYTTGANISGEVAVANNIFQQGADGLIYDAEIEWETNAPTAAARSGLATNLCGPVRANWPNKFMGLSTWPYRASHPNVPYKEFAYYCDVIMPQAYWIEVGDTPTACVARINSEWTSWKNGLTGIWTNAIKPFVMTGQGWSSVSGTVTPAQIGEFETALKNVASPVSPGGFKGVDYWRAELHPSTIWNAIKTNYLSNPYTNAAVIQFGPSTTAASTTATISWPTDQNSDGVVEYGTSTSYGTSVTNSALLWYHTVNLSGLSPDTTYHFRVKSKGTNNLTGVSADYVFTTLATSADDIIIDQDNVNNSGGSTVAYTGTWTANTASSSAYEGNFRYATGISPAGSTPTATAKFTPNIVVAGNYNIYSHWTISGANGNRATNSPYRISHNGELSTNRANHELNGGTFQLIATNKYFPASTSGFVSLGNDITASTGGDIVIADAVKFVYIPPPPSAPSISTQPQNQIVNQGNTAAFSVVAAGTAQLTYQWRLNNADISGATASAYIKNNTQPADAGNYSVTVSNGIGSATSSNASLSVNVPPTISVQPLHQTNSAGTTAIFSVTATGTAPLSYHWSRNGVEMSDGGNISGATSATLTLANVSQIDATNYSVLITNIAGSVSSAVATLTVIEPPQITTQPMSRTNAVGTTATFSVVAGGSGSLGYQWRFGGLEIGGATGSSYGRGNVQGSDAGDYTVVVTNVAGSVTSGVAVLTVVGGGETVRPSVAIVRPAGSFHFGVGETNFYGTAKDTAPGRVAEVRYRLWPETNWSVASLSALNGVTNWTTPVQALHPGSNWLAAYSVDTAGNHSPVRTNLFYYDLTDELTVKIAGHGEVKSATALVVDGQTIPRLVGRPFLLTAFLGKGTNYVFTNWTAGTDMGNLIPVSTNLAYNFLVQSNWIVQANFLTNPFTAVAGIYNGLFFETSGITHGSAGFFTLKASEKAAYSGRLFLDGDAISVSGKFDLGGRSTKVVLRGSRGKADLNLALELDWNSSEIIGTLDSGSWVARMEGDRAKYSLIHPETNFVGSYTFVVPRTNSHPAGGTGYGLVTNNVSGMISLAGGLADGMKLAQKVSVNEAGGWPFFAQLYKSTNIYTNLLKNVLATNKANYRGSVLGWVRFTNQMPVGKLSWIKGGEASPAYLHPGGFTSEVEIVGSRYVAPPDRNTRIIPLTNGTATFSEGNLAGPIAWDINWATNHAITVTSPGILKPTFTLTPKTGLIKGTFPHPQMGNAKSNYYGAVLQNQTNAQGYFLGTNQSGGIKVE